MEKLRLGIIGYGNIGKKHYKVLKQIKEIEVKAVCDPTVNRTLDLINTGIDIYTKYGYEDMLKDENIDVVDICTPTGRHAEIAIAAAKHKKHVITEKPMALTIEDAEAMINACEKNNVKLFVVHQYRFNEAMMKLKETIENNKLGKLVLINATIRWARPQNYYDQDEWRGTKNMDGGVLMNQASHHIDLMRWLFGNVESVYAKTGTMTHNIEVDDTAIGLIKFKNKAIGVIEATTCISTKDLESSITVIGEKGAAKITDVGGFTNHKIELWEVQGENKEEIARKHSNPDNIFGYGLYNFFKGVCDSLNNKNVNIIIDGNEGKETLKVIEALYNSAEQGKEIKLG